MRQAPNVKFLPRDKAAEAVIIAGNRAWNEAKRYQEDNRNGDDVPPIVLDSQQLAALNDLQIIDNGRHSARVYRAGDLSEADLTIIATKLAAAGIKRAYLLNDAGEQVEDWTGQLEQLRSDKALVEGLATASSAEEVDLRFMSENDRASLLAARYDGIAMHTESETVYTYSDGIWERTPLIELRREMVAIYEENDTEYSSRKINSIVDTLKIQVPALPEPISDVIAFSNGVYDLKTGIFSQHAPENGITSHNGITYTPATSGENLHDSAPHFHRWLSHAASNEPRKMQTICAALFMVMANRYDWQLFLEITGDGGSGKSIFTKVATLLAGEHNTASGNMAALDSARGRAQFVGKRVITLPDQPKYSGEGTGIKAITGGDAVEIDPKNEHQYTAILRAVVIATNNAPMIFSERAGGVARRRVIFQFNNRVRDEDKDPALAEKIAEEIPVIVRRLLATFADPEAARQLLIEQRDSDEALEVKIKTDPLYAFCSYLNQLAECVGMFVGNKNPPYRPRACVYHAYLAYLEANGHDRPLTLNKFTEGMITTLREFNHEYRRERKMNGVVTNVNLKENADDWLPSQGGERP
ncbi:phage/plasmid primase, P4 family [Edwardsiella tarda]|uniref:DNA primase family protein n=1 Tax=Edwardsiella tarda TaxID=636 RepID=UPI00351C03F4